MERKITKSRMVTLTSDMTVQFHKSTREELVYFENPTKSSLNRVRRIINSSNGERALVSLYKDGTFGVFVTVYTWEEVQS